MKSKGSVNTAVTMEGVITFEDDRNKKLFGFSFKPTIQ